MNELRMHVEHLFEGKTLTAEMIELKEEIYGNLVARYEDYLAEGLQPAEALARTKASLTSVDDVLAEDEDDAHVRVNRPAHDGVELGANPQEAEQTVDTDSTARVVPGTPVAPTASTSSGDIRPTRKKWPIVAGVVAVVVVLMIGIPLAGLALYGEISESSDRVHISSDGVSVQHDDGRITVDGDGTIRLDGNPVDELLKTVVNADAPESWGLPLTNAGSVEGMVRSLPMKSWLTSVGIDAASGTVTLRYERVPDQFDGDSIDAALVYNATAVLACVPDAQQVRIDLSESDDPTDFDVFAFTRAALEQQYGQQLGGDAIKGNAWDQLKTEHLYRGGFVEQAVDAAELDGR